MLGPLPISLLKWDKDAAIYWKMWKQNTEYKAESHYVEAAFILYHILNFIRQNLRFGFALAKLKLHHSGRCWIFHIS